MDPLRLTRFFDQPAPRSPANMSRLQVCYVPSLCTGVLACLPLHVRARTGRTAARARATVARLLRRFARASTLPHARSTLTHRANDIRSKTTAT